MITSTNNPQVKRIIQLNSKGKARKMARAFVVEGSKMFLEAPVKWIEAIYVSQTFHENNRELLIGRDYEIVSDPVFRHISDTMTPQGILCILKIPEYTLEDLLGGEGRVPFLLVTESIQDPGNLGTMFRTAEGAGVTGILMNHSTVDLFNPKTIRSTMGSIYRVPFCYTEDLGETVTCLQKKGIHFYASHLKGSISYEEENYREPCAFLNNI